MFELKVTVEHCLRLVGASVCFTVALIHLWSETHRVRRGEQGYGAKEGHSASEDDALIEALRGSRIMHPMVVHAFRIPLSSLHDDSSTRLSFW